MYFLSFKPKNGINNHTFSEAALRCTNLLFPPSNDSVDIFDVAHTLRHDIQISDAAQVFQAKPGIFGFSIDLIRGGQLLAQIYQRYVNRPSNE